MSRSEKPISPAAERASILSRGKYEARARREASKRAHVEPLKFGVRLTTTLTRAKMTADGAAIYDASGAVVKEFAVGPTGELATLTVQGTAILVRFMKVAPHNASACRSREAAEDEIRAIEGKALRLAKSLGRHNDALSCTLVLADDSDNWLLIGASPRALALFMRKGYEQGIIESYEYLQTTRIPVVASGASDNSACQRSAYKELMREKKTPKAMRDLQARASHTRDESELALLCKCAKCGRKIADHDDSKCNEPQFVVDPKQVGAANLSTVDNRPSPGVRKNRRVHTRAHAVGTANDATAIKVRKPISNAQRAEGAPVYCGHCGAPLSLCRCGKARGRLTREQIKQGMTESDE